jgi:hypothetical protein
MKSKNIHPDYKPLDVYEGVWKFVHCSVTNIDLFFGDNVEKILVPLS